MPRARPPDERSESAVAPHNHAISTAVCNATAPIPPWHRPCRKPGDDPVAVPYVVEPQRGENTHGRDPMTQARSGKGKLIMGLCGKALLAIALLALALAPAFAAQRESATLRGAVQSGGIGLAQYTVSLYIAYLQRGPDWKLLASTTSDGTGQFLI